jgi:hypothetical protein
VPLEGFASTPSSKLLSSHCPSRVMKTGTASYFAGSSARMTLVAESTETSCSAERPPKSTAMRSLFEEVAMKGSKMIWTWKGQKSMAMPRAGDREGAQGLQFE